jgi:hypothetical protein
VKEDVVTKIEKKIFRWFGHVDNVDERGMTRDL